VRSRRRASSSPPWACWRDGTDTDHADGEHRFVTALSHKQTWMSGSDAFASPSIATSTKHVAFDAISQTPHWASSHCDGIQENEASITTQYLVSHKRVVKQSDKGAFYVISLYAKVLVSIHLKTQIDAHVAITIQLRCTPSYW
jgi:hypothetical protein